MKTSLFLKIGKSDLIKGAIMAGGSVIATALVVVLQGFIAVPPVYPTLHSLELILVSGIIAGAVYLLKNLFTNSQDQFMKKEPIEEPKK